MSELLTLAQLELKTLKEIYNYAKELKIPYYRKIKKKDIKHN